MKSIYLIVSAPPTIPAKIIGLFTKNVYNHISISLDQNLEKFHSFGRLYRYFFYPGGYINEGWNKGCFLYLQHNKMVVLQLDVTDIEYITVQQKLLVFEQNRKKYKYDFLNILSQAIGKPLPRKNPYKFTCASFVCTVLNEKLVFDKPLTLVRPSDFLQLNLNTIYKGEAKDYGRFFTQN